MSDHMVVTGPSKLYGHVSISGAKNAALPLLASSLLTQGVCTWRNVPTLDDVHTLLQLLEDLGVETHWQPEHHTVTLDTQHIRTYHAPYERVKAMRASVLVLGPLLARYGQARVSMPGGCAIGARPVDQHICGLEALGATVTLEHGDIVAQAKQLKGTRFAFDMPTVGGTENVMMAAVLAHGYTVLENVAREPEIVALAEALNAMGARIEGAGTSTLHIQGVDTLHPIEHTIMPDRIEAGTFLVAATLCQGNVWVHHTRPADLEAVFDTLRQAGAQVELQGNVVHVQGPATIQPFHVTTAPHPGFPTDLQAPFLTLACCAQGQSTLTETLFENRYMHVPELLRMGARIHIQGQTAVVTGGAKLFGTDVEATDLRAGAGLVLAGLAAEGITTVRRIDYLDRGYEHMEQKLQGLGAAVQRVSSSSL